MLIYKKDLSNKKLQRAPICDSPLNLCSLTIEQEPSLKITLLFNQIDIKKKNIIGIEMDLEELREELKKRGFFIVPTTGVQL